MNPSSFNFTYKSLVNVLETPIEVAAAFSPNLVVGAAQPLHLKCRALWDTGATNSSITEAVVSQLSLKQVAIKKVYNAHGEFRMCPAFLVNILLPSNVGIAGVLVSQGSFGAGKDVLIGMDVIGKGDFAVSNFSGKTSFSFRVPSCADLELPSPKPGELAKKDPTAYHADRNDPCPCGSGRKFKKCHGSDLPTNPAYK